MIYFAINKPAVDGTIIIEPGVLAFKIGSSFENTTLILFNSKPNCRHS